MASSTLAALLLLLLVQALAYVAVRADDKDYGFECPQQNEAPMSKDDLETMLEKRMRANGVEVDRSSGVSSTSGGGSGIWSWLARLNGAGVREDQGENTDRTAMGKKTKKPARGMKKKGGMHPKGVGMHPKGKGMHGPGKGMHKRRPRGPVPGPRPSGGFRADIVVAADGSGQYKKVQAAINAARRGQPGAPFIIYVKGGNYYEKILVPKAKQYITIVGDKGRTRIYYDDSAGKSDGTSASASFTILADNFVAVDVTFENTYGWPNGREGSQAVAVLVNSDQTQFYGCTFLGHQDTLYAQAGRQYYYQCHIVGQVDFIFGNARAIFDNCLTEAINNADNRYTAVCAQNRPSEDYESGFVFLGGRLIGTGVSFPEYGAYLGRTWGKWSTVIYIKMEISLPVRPEGWSNMGQSENEKNAILRVYQCTGVGSSGRSWEIGKQATAAEAAKYDGIDYIDGGSWVRRPSWWRG